MQKPWHSLLFGMVVFLFLGLMAFYFPTEGLKIGNLPALKFLNLSTLIHKSPVKKDISKILKAADEAEDVKLPTVELPDTAFAKKDLVEKKKWKARKRDTILDLITSIQMKDPNALSEFFDAIRELQMFKKEQVRVLHYGDSQIEGDRITSQLRQRLQTEFGGSGPGLISLMPVSNSVINRITLDGAWTRFSAGTGKDKRVTHRAFGPMISFTRFLPYVKLTDTSRAYAASATINTTRAGGAEVMKYENIKLFYGGAKRKTWCEYYDGPILLSADSLQSGGLLNMKEFKAGNGSFAHKIKFRGKDSPDIYGVSLETSTGILVDNIPLRGSSGTFFHQLDPNQLRLFYQFLNVKLIILQFGGNALPFITNDTLARSYASWIKGQIALVKKLAPESSILFIGPADMSVKEGTEYVTHPYLELVRDELKRVVLDSHCAYFDMYDCMGGQNSMSAWVEEKLAASDYIHFSPQGARKVAALLHTALISAYSNYIEEKN